MREKLEILLKENPNTITAEVIQEALSNSHEEPEDFFKLLFEHGCQS